jgi:hypothetical protein
MLSKTERKPMSNTADLENPTLESLAVEVRRLRERMEDRVGQHGAEHF